MGRRFVFSTTGKGGIEVLALIGFGECISTTDKNAVPALCGME